MTNEETRWVAALNVAVYMCNGSMRRLARAAAKRASLKAPFLEPGFWEDSSDAHELVGDGKRAMAYLASTDKSFWLRLAVQEDTIPGYLEDNSEEHEFTRKELIPLLQHTDPEIRMLGLSLIAGIVPDATKPSVRVRGRRKLAGE